MIDVAQEFAIAVEHLLLDVGGQLIVAPGLAQLRGAAVAVALGEERARQHQPSHARLRRRVLEEAHGLRRLDVLHPQHRLGAAAEHAQARPIRIGGDEGEVARARGAVAVAAQDDPFDELARRRVGDGGLDVGRLAGAALAQALDGALDQRDLGLRGLRLRPLRQRDLRHHGFVGDRFLSFLPSLLSLDFWPPASCWPCRRAFRPCRRPWRSRRTCSCGQCSGRSGGTRFWRRARRRGLRHERRHEQAPQASAATSADRSCRVKSACPPTRRITSPPAPIRAPALTDRYLSQDLGGKANRDGICRLRWIVGRYRATYPRGCPTLARPSLARMDRPIAGWVKERSRKSGYRFSEKIMLQQEARADDSKKVIPL